MVRFDKGLERFQPFVVYSDSYQASVSCWTKRPDLFILMTWRVKMAFSIAITRKHGQNGRE
jgi:hypothetical protein